MRLSVALVSPQARDQRVRNASFALAVLVPLAAYVATLSGAGFWLDAGELTAAAVDLDIAHPPGHPLASLVGHAATPDGVASTRTA